MDIYEFLSEHGITYERIDHPPVMTCEEALAVLPNLEEAHTKNLFLRDKKGVRHILVSVGYEKSVDLNAFAEAAEISKPSFGSAERLMDHLGVEPGSVTLLGLINDPEHKVEVIIDQALWDADTILCHPLVNTATLKIDHDDLVKFFEATGHDVKVMDIPER